jgi:hypothetical protein
MLVSRATENSCLVAYEFSSTQTHCEELVHPGFFFLFSCQNVGEFLFAKMDDFIIGNYI